MMGKKLRETISLSRDLPWNPALGDLNPREKISSKTPSLTLQRKKEI